MGKDKHTHDEKGLYGHHHGHGGYPPGAYPPGPGGYPAPGGYPPPSHAYPPGHGYPPQGYPPQGCPLAGYPLGAYPPGHMGPLVAGVVGPVAGAYGAHRIGDGTNPYGHRASHMGHVTYGHHGKFKHGKRGKFKHGKHRIFGRKFKKWK